MNIKIHPPNIDWFKCFVYVNSGQSKLVQTEFSNLSFSYENRKWRGYWGSKWGSELENHINL